MLDPIKDLVLWRNFSSEIFSAKHQEKNMYVMYTPLSPTFIYINNWGMQGYTYFPFFFKT